MIVTLLTDFGDSDPYVASMKGVILSIDPQIRLVDVSHNIRPHQIKHAAWVLNCCWTYYPEGTVHVAVVDPGVGGDRRVVVVTKENQTFVGPDNGVFSYLYSGAYQIYEVTDFKYAREEVSDTFHGRDLFAPLAAHLSKGLEVDEIGRPIDDPVVFAIPHPEETREGLRGAVIYVDGFGNLTTNIRKDLFDSVFSDRGFDILINSRQIAGIARSYDGHPPGSLLAIWGSESNLEISANLSNAAAQLGIEEADCEQVEVLIRKEGK
jgi:S-adenosylmethionine hydrolase